MKTNRFLSIFLTWAPSLAITFFYIPKGLDKLLNPNQTGKIVENSAIMIIAGIFILLGNALFLYNKTIQIGTSMLVLYISCVILIHMYRDKPAEIVILMLIATIFASYIRAPKHFHKNSTT